MSSGMSAGGCRSNGCLGCAAGGGKPSKARVRASMSLSRSKLSCGEATCIRHEAGGLPASAAAGAAIS